MSYCICQMSLHEDSFMYQSQNGVKSVHLDDDNCDCYSTLGRCVSNLCSRKTSVQPGSLHLVPTVVSGVWVLTAKSRAWGYFRFLSKTQRPNCFTALTWRERPVTAGRNMHSGWSSCVYQPHPAYSPARHALNAHALKSAGHVGFVV